MMIVLLWTFDIYISMAIFIVTTLQVITSINCKLIDSSLLLLLYSEEITTTLIVLLFAVFFIF